MSSLMVVEAGTILSAAGRMLKFYHDLFILPSVKPLTVSKR